MNFPISLNRQSRVPLKRQLYEEMKRLILSGHWEPGDKLPSTRAISDWLSVSRPTTNWACAQLLNEGYIESFAGSGNFVARDLPDELLQPNAKSPGADQPEVTASLSECGNYLLSQARSELHPPQVEIDFREGPPCVTELPIKQWQSLLRKYYGADPSLLNYAPDSKGYYPLRQALARYVFRARSIRCSADQIILVNGTQQALNLVARVHCDPGDPVALEDPGYHAARQVFQSFGATLWPIPVDETGLDTSILDALETIRFKALYLTPSHQFPLGSVLPLARRLKVIEWARKTGAVIVEDDYDGEFRYSGPPIPALAALDHGSSVIYIGTFSKCLFPSLRIGYLIVPEELIDVYAWAKKLTDTYSSTLDQCVLTAFIDDGSLEKYIRRMRKVYGQKRSHLVQALQDHFGDSVSILGEDAGLFVPVRFKTELDDQTIIDQAASLGVGLRCTRGQYLADTYTKGEFILSFGNVDEKLIEEGVRRLAKLILSGSHISQGDETVPKPAPGATIKSG
jgi:GntR family transcriptional regulator/MocR family aminotransferase